MKAEAGANWDIGKREYVKTEYFWELCKDDGMDEYGNGIYGNYYCVDLKRDLWLLLGRSMCKKRRNVFDEQMIYVKNDIKNPFIMGILYYAEHVYNCFEMTRYVYTTSNNN